jgi:ABC-type sugar transport system permease subunit
MTAGTVDVATNQTRPHGRYLASRLWEKMAPYVFISPFFILFAVFGAFPILFSLWLSFHDWKGLRAGDWVGLGNYTTLLADPQFRTAIGNTFILGFIYVPLMVVASLGLAAVLNRGIAMRGFYRTGYFLPVITSLVVVGILFSFFLGSPYSPLSALLKPFGIEFRGLLGEAWFVKPAIVAMLLWRWVGYNMLIMLAGLQSIPDELYDAGRIDGAGGFQAFQYITVPMMSRVIAFAAILSTIGMFNLFDEVYMVTGTTGGVQQAGLVTGVLVYRTAFQNYKFGYASAIAYAVAAIIILLSLLQVYASERTAG